MTSSISQADTYCFTSVQQSSSPKRALCPFESTLSADAMSFDHNQQPAKLFVGSIAGTTTKEDLVRMFSAFGPIVEVVILVEKDGRPKFSAFINMKRRSDAERAIAALDRSHTIPGAKKILEVRFAQNGLLKVPNVEDDETIGHVNKAERSLSSDTSVGSTDADSSVASPRFDYTAFFSVKVGERTEISPSPTGFEVCVPDHYCAVLTWLELTELGLPARLV